MNKMLIIINPSSGDQAGIELGKSIRTIYEQKGFETKNYQTTGNDHFKELVEESMNDGFDTVAIAGGDGTISEFINAITLLERRPKIILLPLGTTNNFARALGSELNHNRLLEIIENDELVEKKSDVGRINEHSFISSVAVGVIPTVGWETEDDLKAKLGSLAYVLEGIKLIGENEQESFDFKIKTDTEEIDKKDVFLFIVSLSNSVFGIQTFFEEASFDDGKLHFFGLKKASLLEEANAIMRHILTDDQQTDEENELTFSGSFKKVKLESDDEFSFLVDGEKGTTFPIELDVLHNHLTFLVPERE